MKINKLFIFSFFLEKKTLFYCTECYWKHFSGDKPTSCLCMKEIKRLRIVKNGNIMSYRCSRCERFTRDKIVAHCQRLDDFRFKHTPFNECPYAILPKFMNTYKRCVRCHQNYNTTFRQNLGTVWVCENCESKTLHFITKNYVLPLTVECDDFSFKNSIGICWQCKLCRSCIISEVFLNDKQNITFYCPFC